MEVSQLRPDNAGDRAGQSALLVTYIPIRAGQPRDRRLRSRLRSRRVTPGSTTARRTIWVSVAAGFVLLYASLFAIVRGASRRLIRQVREIAVLGGAGARGRRPCARSTA